MPQLKNTSNQGQDIHRPERVHFEPGEEKEVSDEVFEAHKDRTIFEEGDGESFECDECGDSFDTERGLKTHKTQTHSSDSEEESEE